MSQPSSDISGLYMAMDDEGDPVMVRLDSLPDVALLPAFTTLSKLKKVMDEIDCVCDHVIQITDPKSVLTWFLGARAAAALDGDELRFVIDLECEDGVVAFTNLAISFH